MQEAQLSHQAPAMTSSNPKALPEAQRAENGTLPTSLTRPVSREKESDIYKMMVLRFDKSMTEEDVDRQFVQMAHSLGINVPRATSESLEDVTDGMSAMSMARAPSEAPISPTSPASSIPPLSPSSASRNTHPKAPPSDSSSDQHSDVRGPVMATPSISSVVSSQNSVASSDRSSSKSFKRGFRRFTAKRRKSTESSVPTLPFDLATTKDIRPVAQNYNTSQTISTVDPPKTHRVLNPRSSSVAPAHVHPSQSSPPVPILDDTLLEDTPASRQRSMHCQRLKDLRGSQLQEQLRFIRFERDQYRQIRSKYAVSQQETLAQNEAKEKDLENAHSEALIALEQRHLDAEADLVQTLENERQACETRLKHMQAYCSPKNTVKGMPERVVTKKDYNQLEAQYRLRNNMENLHTSRINVLRERQAKQQERILAKQESEMEVFEQERRNALEDLESLRKDETSKLEKEFAARKNRLVARWALSEAIERRKLENETGEAYGALPPIAWPDRGEMDDVGDADSGHGSGSVGSSDDSNDLAKDAVLAYT